jgi:hypothetical protein
MQGGDTKRGSDGPDPGKEAVVSVAAGGPLTVECALRVEARADWRLNGSAVPADMVPGGERAADGRLTARLLLASALYPCIVLAKRGGAWGNTS